MKEHELEKSFNEILLPFFSKWNRWSFKGKKGLRIEAASIFEEREDAIVILHGKSESFFRYIELVYDLKDRNLGFYFMDQRGMGFSERETQDNNKVHISDFNDYIDDFSFFVETVREKVRGNLYLFAHSMGGAVAVRFLGGNSNVFRKAVLSSPMIGLDSKLMGKVVSSFYVFTNRGEKYLPFQRNSSENGGIENTSSQIRWNLWKKVSCSLFPILRSGGVSCRWLYETLKVLDNMAATNIKTETLLLQAEKDTIVDNSESLTLALNNTASVKLFTSQSSRHEIFMERDELRTAAVSELIKFLGI